MKRAVNIDKRIRKMNNKGLSILELIIAIAIIGILSVSIVHSMVSSSKTYYKSSTEAQLQSEAQLVANSITEIAIDSFSAKDKMEGSDASDFGVDDSTTYDTTDKKVLLLYSKEAGGTQYQYAVVRNKKTNNLELIERVNSSGSWSRTPSAVLANYISDFEPDTSRVDTENMLSFKLTYQKQDASDGNIREYKGNYQVLMRNKLYAGTSTVSNNNPSQVKVSMTLVPKVIYLDVKGSQVAGETGIDYVTGYHVTTINDNPGSVGTITEDISHPGSAVGVSLTATVMPTIYNTDVDWKLSNVNKDYFYFIKDDGTKVDNSDDGPLTPAVKLQWDKNKNMKDLLVDSFDAIASKTVTVTQPGSTASTDVTAGPKKVSIKIRRIRQMSLRPTTGMTTWQKEFTTDCGGTQSAEATYYAKIAGNGYENMIIQSSALAPNVENGGGIEWKLSMKMSETEPWREITSADDMRLYARLTPGNPSIANGGLATISFGSAAANGQLYKIETTSTWDQTRSASMIIGVAPRGGGNSDGFYSRGYYVDLLSWVQSNPKYTGVTDLQNVTVKSSGGTSEAASYKIVQRDGRWYLLYDYNAAYYSGEQRLNFYQALQDLQLEIVNQTGNLGNINAPNGTDKGATGNILHYYTLPVYVNKIAPTVERMVLKKGDARTLNVQTAYYNLHDSSFFGVYIGDDGDAEAMKENLNKSGLNESNQYLAFSIDPSQYGGLYTYRDSIKTNLSVKNTTRAYNPNPMKVRLTADDYYVLSKYGADSNNSNGTPTSAGSAEVKIGSGENMQLYKSSYVDYIVYIANVAGADAFVSCPATGDADSDVRWATFKANVDGANSRNNAVDVNGYNANGDLVRGIGQAYKDGNKYKLIYKGVEYTYNQTYKYWAK